MRIIMLQLRGAIGISKGLGVEEIEIDFSSFTSGLIALIGENGKGKTTIIENLHPYRRLVSREGNLADHFYLKDSYRKLTFNYSGDVYTSEIYIDGYTKKVEAYLKKDGISLNDGKLTTYDEIVETILGSEELFFNGLFSAQKSKGISELTANQKRDLFYELLKLDNYQYYQEVSKRFLAKEELKREKISLKIESNKNDLERLSRVEAELNFKTENIIGIKRQIQAIDNQVSEQSLIKQQQDYQMFSLLESRKSNAASKQKIANLEDEINSVNIDLNSKLVLLSKEKEKKLLKLIQEDSSFALLEQEISALDDNLKKLKLSLSIKKIEEEIHALDEEQLKIEQKIISLQEFLKHEDEIYGQVERLIKLKSAIEEYNNEEMIIVSSKLELENARTTELSSLLPQYENLERLNKIYNETDVKLRLLESDKRSLSSAYKEKRDRIDEEISIIERVPCSKEVGKNCNFLVNAYNSKEQSGEISAEYEEKLSTLNLEINLLEESFNSIETEIKKITSALKAKELLIIESHSKELGALSAKKDKMELYRSQTLFEWERLSILNPERKLEELKTSSNELEFASQRITNIKQLKDSKIFLIHEVKAKEDEQAKSIIEKKQSLLAQIEESNLKLETARYDCIAEYEESKRLVEVQAKEKIHQLNNWITTEQKNIQINIEEEILSLKKSIEALAFQLTESIQEKESLNRILTEEETKITFLEEEILKRSRIREETKTLETDLALVQKDITEYSFLVRAFDKTGIPVLKLENSGNEITNIANDLLSAFQNNFRIAFETTRLTKDRKKLKEIFDINVIDSDGITELKNKSGGEKVWIESSLQLALGILLRRQGKRHETCFLDEQDGALDIGNALSYRVMIEEAHSKSGAYNSILITHRSELMEFIEQKIVLNENSIQIIA